MMQQSKIYVSNEVDVRLRLLKSRTGLTPNLLCRIGFCLSLSEPGVPDPALYSADQGREFNRYTLTGQWDALFFALLRERLSQDGLPVQENIEPQFRAHLSRGVMLLFQRAKQPADILRMATGRQESGVK